MAEKNEKTAEILEDFKSIVNEPDEEITEAEFEETPSVVEVDTSENEELEPVGESNE